LSLRDDFLEAKKKPRNEIPYGYEGISAALAKFAEQVPAEMSSLIKRIDLGERIYETLEPGLQLEVPFSASYSWMQHDKATLEKLPGYALLLRTCASDEVDVCCTITVAQKDYRSSAAVLRVAIAPAEPFEKSQLHITLGKSQGSFEIGKEDWKPKLDKPKLRAPSQRAE
jgi:hypothetical protein